MNIDTIINTSGFSENENSLREGLVKDEECIYVSNLSNVNKLLMQNSDLDSI